MKCEACDGTGLYQGPYAAIIQPLCAVCNGRGTVRPRDDDLVI